MYLKETYTHIGTHLSDAAPISKVWKKKVIAIQLHFIIGQ
jgi:hypothetical protein